MNSRQSIITLLTDFGMQDYFVGAMKGVILCLNPAATIVDITHEIPPQDIQAAAFNLFACYRDFPAGTIHLAVVDPGVGSDRRAILVECARQYFVGPDNGLFSWIVEREGNFSAWQVTNDTFFRQPVSSTFHGRDVFAPVAAALASGTPPEEFGPRLKNVVTLASLLPRTRGDAIEGSIIHIDRFGNCITNFTSEHFNKERMAAGAKLIVKNKAITSIRKFFADQSGHDNEPFMLVGSAGFVEIASQNASASAALSAQRGDRVLLIHEDSA